jgi:hypothetical protein
MIWQKACGSGNHSNQDCAPNELHQTMPVAQNDSAKRRLKSSRQVGLPPLSDLELGVLLPLLFVANVIVATTAWYVVGSLLR